MIRRSFGLRLSCWSIAAAAKAIHRPSSTRPHAAHCTALHSTSLAQQHSNTTLTHTTCELRHPIHHSPRVVHRRSAERSRHPPFVPFAVRPLHSLPTPSTSPPPNAMTLFAHMEVGTNDAQHASATRGTTEGRHGSAISSANRALTLVSLCHLPSAPLAPPPAPAATSFTCASASSTSATVSFA